MDLFKDYLPVLAVQATAKPYNSCWEVLSTIITLYWSSCNTACTIAGCKYIVLVSVHAIIFCCQD